MEHCDLTDRERVEAIVAGARPEWLFQCAGATRAKDPQDMYAVHVSGALNVLSAVARHSLGTKVIFLGSAAEYGPVEPAALPVSEDHATAPTSFFGASKLAQTHAARAAAADWKLSVIVVRPFNLLGPGLPRHYFAAALAERLRQAQATGQSGDMPVVNAAATRDFVDVRDVVQALVQLATRAAPPAGEMALYNVASGQEVPLLAVAQKLCTLAGGRQATDAGSGQSRSGIGRSCGDASRLRRATGWAPRLSWEQSVDDLWRASVAGEER
jgi:GDP-4-dehydro-6-deoxy-D-mannose reductase